LVYFINRSLNEVDPPITPTKLLLIERIKPLKGNPYWEKEILKNIGLGSEVKHQIIIFNLYKFISLIIKKIYI
jgi:large subunit ribosomal protein L30